MNYMMLPYKSYVISNLLDSLCLQENPIFHGKKNIDSCRCSLQPIRGLVCNDSGMFFLIPDKAGGYIIIEYYRSIISHIYWLPLDHSDCTGVE